MKFAANSLPQTLVILLILPLRALSLTRSLSMSSSSSIKIPKRISIISAGFTAINGVYQQKSPSRIPAGFDRTCRAMKWDTVQLWNQLSDNKRWSIRRWGLYRETRWMGSSQEWLGCFRLGLFTSTDCRSCGRPIDIL